MARAPRVPIEALAAGEHELPEDAAQYLARVLRLRAGDALVGFDPAGAIEADGVVTRAERGRVRVRFDAPRAASNVAPRPLVLLQCVGKGHKLDQVVRDATELGATAIWPVLAERTVAERTGDSALARLRRVALEAARQCGRGDVPEVAPPRALPDALAACSADVRLVLHPRAATRAGDALREAERGASVAVLIGPEGGLSEAELLAAAEAGFSAVRFGWTVLRTETAAAAILGAIVVITSSDG